MYFPPEYREIQIVPRSRLVLSDSGGCDGDDGGMEEGGEV